MRSSCAGWIVPITTFLFVSIAYVRAEQAAPGQKPVRLENAFCLVEVDPTCGTLRRVVDKEGSLDLRSSPQTAGNFRLLMPLPDDRENYIVGRDQALSRVQRSDDRLTLHWAGPLKDGHGNEHALAATMSIELAERSIVFRFRLENRTEHMVLEVWYPCLGGLLRFGSPENCGQATLNPPPHNRRFKSPFNSHTITYPGQNMAFVQIDNPAIHRAMYLGAHDKIARFKAFHFREVKANQRRNVVFDLIHFPSVQPGGIFEASPLVVQFHDGDWIDGGKKIYRPWFIETFGLMSPERDWIRQHGFFQLVMAMLPEGNINYTIKEIPQVARDGLKYGVRSLLITGWQLGGHDNGYPYYEPDPRLGTWEDMREALRECHELGVKVYFFVNILVNNLDTQWYKEELKDYDFESIEGFPYSIDGWGMGTIASRMGYTVPLMVFADTSFPGVRDKLLAYFTKLAEIGADGIHIDKLYPRALNFNPRAPMSPDQSPWEGVIQLLDLIDRESRKINPDFQMSFETLWDRVLQYGTATWWVGNMSGARKVFPELVETIALCQPYNYIGVNDAVRNGHAVMVSPHRHNRTMDVETFRGLSTYMGQLKKIREQLADVFFYGELLGTEGVDFQGKALPKGVECAAYRDLKSGRRGCILTNRRSRAETVTLVAFDEWKGSRMEIHKPHKDAVSVKLPAEITIEPERIVFVVGVNE